MDLREAQAAKISPGDLGRMQQWLPQFSDTASVVCEVARHGFGPRGSKFLEAHAGSGFAAIRGLEALRSLPAESSPGAAFLSQCLKDHARECGDGQATLALMITGGFREVFAEGRQHALPTGVSASRLGTWMARCVALVEDVLKSTSLQVSLDIETHQAEAERQLAAVAASSFTGHMPGQTPFAHELAKALAISDYPKDEICQRLHLLSSLPPVLCIPGNPMTDVEVGDGLVLRHGLRTASMPRQLGPVHLAVISYQIDHFVQSDMPATIEVKGSAGYTSLAGQQSGGVQLHVQALTERSIKLIVSTEPISDAVAFVLEREGISAIQLVSTSEAELVAAASGCTVMQNKDRFSVGQCTSLVEAPVFDGTVQRPCQWMRFSRPSPLLIVRAPTSSLCRHCQRAVACGISAIRHAVTVDVEHKLPFLAIVPGAAATEVAIAAQVGDILAETRVSPSRSHPWLQGHQPSPESVLALQVIRAMALAIPEALVDSFSATQPKLSQAAAGKGLMHALDKLHSAEKRWSAPALGIVDRTSQPGCGLECSGPVEMLSRAPPALAMEIVIDDPMKYRCCHPLSTTLARWSTAVTVLSQVLRISHVSHTGIR